MTNHLDFIMDAEQGNLKAEAMVRGTAALVADGTIWHLQGCWQRSARAMIDTGLISETGDVDEDALAQALER
jgi:hypothetical protein